MRRVIPLLVRQDSLSAKNTIVFTQNPTSFVFDSPWLKSEGEEGLQKYYQVFLSAANPDTFFSGNLSSTPLSSVDYFSENNTLSARFPAFSGFNIKDFGGQVLRNDSTQEIRVNISALSARATGHFQFVITAPGGQTIWPAAPDYYAQSFFDPITPTPTQTHKQP